VGRLGWDLSPTTVCNIRTYAEHVKGKMGKTKNARTQGLKNVGIHECRNERIQGCGQMLSCQMVRKFRCFGLKMS